MKTQFKKMTRRYSATLVTFIMFFILSAQTVLAASDYSGVNAVGVNTSNAAEAINAGGGVATMALDGGSLSVSGFTGVPGQTISRVTLGMSYTRVGNANPHDDRIVLGYTLNGVLGASSKPSFNPTQGVLKTTTFNITGDRAWTPEDINDLAVTVTPEIAGGVADANSVQIDHLYVTINYTPVASNLAIAPTNPHDDEDLVASYLYTDENNDAEDLDLLTAGHTQIRWFRKNVGQANFQQQNAFNDIATVPAADTADGQQWRFTVRPNDGQVNGTIITSDAVTIRTNTAPVLNAVGAQSTYETDALNFNVSATDAEDDPLTYSAANLPVGANLTAEGAFSWTPTFDQQPSFVDGTYDVTFVVSDTYGGSDSEVVTITVQNLDRTPVLEAIGPKSIDENQLLTFPMNVSDSDGDVILYSGENLPAGAVVDENSGVFTWTPDFTQAGVYAVTLHADDGYGGTVPGERQNSGHASEVIQITVNNVNRIPVLNAVGNQSVNEGDNLSVQLVANDEDLADVLLYSIVNLPAGAAFDVNTGLLTWTPTFIQSGDYPITVGVSDGITSVTEDLTITVNNVNRAPVLGAVGNRATAEGIQVTIQLSSTDDDGDIPTYTIASQPAGADFDTVTGLFNWIPDAEQGNLNDTNYNITFGVTDGTDSATEDIVISVGNVDRPPEFAAVADQTGNENELLSFVVSAVDPDGQTVTLSAANLPGNAAFDPLTGTFSWTPTFADANVYNNVTFTAQSGPEEGVPLTDTVIISITVNNVNRAPVLDAVGNKTVITGNELQIQLSGSDADEQALSFAFDGDAVGATINGETGLFTWTPTTEQVGDHSVTFAINDDTENDSETITITVTAPDQAPVLNPIGNKSANNGTLMTFNVTASDPDGDAVTITVTNLPNGAAFDGNQFSWVPIDAGSFLVSFIATSGSEPVLNDAETITILIESGNSGGIIGVGAGPGPSNPTGGSVPTVSVQTPPSNPTTPVVVTPPETPSVVVTPPIEFTLIVPPTISTVTPTAPEESVTTAAVTDDNESNAAGENGTGDNANGVGGNGGTSEVTPVVAVADTGNGGTPTSAAAKNTTTVKRTASAPTEPTVEPTVKSAPELSQNVAQANLLGDGAGDGAFNYTDFIISIIILLIALIAWYLYNQQRRRNAKK